MEKQLNFNLSFIRPHVRAWASDSDFFCWFVSANRHTMHVSVRVWPVKGCVCVGEGGGGWILEMMTHLTSLEGTELKKNAQHKL